MKAFVLVSMLALTSTAMAGPKPLPGSQHEPPVWLDVPSRWIQVHTNADGFTLQVALTMVGMTAKSDRVRMEVRSGSKVVAKVDCTGTEYNEKEKFKDLECETADNFKASGPLELDFIYADDQTSKEYAVTTLKINVKAWNQAGTKSWSFTPDDLLALTWVLPEDTMGEGHVVVRYWSTEKRDGTPKTALRCTVDGKNIDDINVKYGKNPDLGEISSGFKSGNAKLDRTFAYWPVQLLADLRWGGRKQGNGDTWTALGEHPGKWDCTVEANGKQLRQLLFTVNDKGEITPSAMQTGAKPLRSLTWEILVDSRIPKQHAETRIRPEALNKSVGFGVAWPDGPGAKEAQAAFPAAVGKD